MGEVNLHGRFPQLQVAVSPSDARTRAVAKRVLDRLLQNHDTGKTLEFLGLSGPESVGGDGTWGEEEKVIMNSDQWSNSNGVNSSAQQAMRANGAASAVMIAARTKQQIQSAKDSTVPTAVALPPPVLSKQSSAAVSIPYDQQRTAPKSPALDLLMTHSLSDHADPSSALAFKFSIHASSWHSFVIPTMKHDPTSMGPYPGIRVIPPSLDSTPMEPPSPRPEN